MKLRNPFRRKRSGSASMLRARMYGVPLAVDAARFEAFASVAESLSPDALTVEALSAAVPRTGSRVEVSRRGDGFVNVHGPLVNRPSAFDELCGLTSYQQIRADIEEALADPEVHRIVLDIDSPGGEVSGISDLAAFIREARTRKPIVALVNEHAFSAAYWIASQATQIVAPRLAMVGSIGVILRHVDRSGANDKAGVTITNIIAGAKKADGSPDTPLSDTARADLQRIVDATYDAFVADVAAGRGISEDAVRATEAGVYMAADALAIGLVDRIASIDEALDEEEEEGREDDDAPPKDEDEADPDEDDSDKDQEDEVTEAQHKALVAQAVAQERERVTAELRSQARAMIGIANDIGVESSVAVELFADGVSVEAARKAMFDRKASAQERVEINNYAPDVSAQRKANTAADELLAAVRRLNERSR